jgi:hypothetical protein
MIPEAAPGVLRRCVVWSCNIHGLALHVRLYLIDSAGKNMRHFSA